MREVKLSKNKFSFMMQKEPSDPKGLSINILQNIIEHYYNKYKIKIIINGVIPANVDYIRKKKAEHLAIIKAYNHESKYAKFISRINFDNLDDNEEVSLQREEIKEIIKKTSPQYIQFISSKDEEYKFIERCNSLPPDLKSKIDAAIQKDKIEFHQAKMNSIGIDDEQMAEEVTAIQKSLQEDEMVGYLCNGQKLRRHWEVLIISKRAIIKPVHWAKGEDKFYADPEYFPNKIFYDASMAQLNKSDIEPELYSPPLMQGTAEGCTTLLLKNLQALLKDNAKQLRTQTLTFTFYDNNDQHTHFYFPPPHVLRYAQSETYVKAVVSLIENTDFCEINCVFFNGESIEHKSFQFESIESLLRKTLQKSSQLNDDSVREEAKTTLGKLPEFRKKWLADYKVISQQRESMTKNSQNQHLTYSSIRYNQKFFDSQPAHALAYKAWLTKLLSLDPSTSPIPAIAPYDEEAKKGTFKKLG